MPNSSVMCGNYCFKPQTLVWKSFKKGFDETVFLNGPTPASLSFFNQMAKFSSNQFEICPSSIQRRDSNLRPPEHESHPLTTRQGLQPYWKKLCCRLQCWCIKQIFGHSFKLGDYILNWKVFAKKLFNLANLFSEMSQLWRQRNISIDCWNMFV